MTHKLSILGNAFITKANFRNSDWEYFETPLFTVNNTNIKVCDVAFKVTNLGTGYAYLENLTLAEFDTNGNFIRYLYNGIPLQDGVPSRFSFDVMNDDFILWSFDDSGTKGIDQNIDTVWVTGTTDWAELAISDYFEVRQGYSYRASGYIYLFDCDRDAEVSVIMSFFE